MKVEDGDVVVSIEGMAMEEAFQSAEGRQKLAKFRSPKLGDEMTMTVSRNGALVELKGAARTLDVKEYHFIEINPSPTPEQKALRNAVFYAKAR
jgi:predicted metalloprotease with PDZ domain